MPHIRISREFPDPDEYFRMFETTGWNAGYRASAEELANTLRQSWYFLCAFDGPKLVASGRVVSDGVLYGMVYDLITLPEYQEQGIGSRILAALVEKCRSGELRAIQLFSASGKTGFYQKRGFVIRPEDRPGMTYLRKPS